MPYERADTVPGQTNQAIKGSQAKRLPADPVSGAF